MNMKENVRMIVIIFPIKTNKFLIRRTIVGTVVPTELRRMPGEKKKKISKRKMASMLTPPPTLPSLLTTSSPQMNDDALLPPMTHVMPRTMCVLKLLDVWVVELFRWKAFRFLSEWTQQSPDLRASVARRIVIEWGRLWPRPRHEPAIDVWWPLDSSLENNIDVGWSRLLSHRVDTQLRAPLLQWTLSSEPTTLVTAAFCRLCPSDETKSRLFDELTDWKTHLLGSTAPKPGATLWSLQEVETNWMACHLLLFGSNITSSVAARRWVKQLSQRKVHHSLPDINPGLRYLHDAVQERWTLLSRKAHKTLESKEAVDAIQQCMIEDIRLYDQTRHQAPVATPRELWIGTWLRYLDSTHAAMKLRLSTVKLPEPVPAWWQDWSRRLSSMPTNLLSHWMDLNLDWAAPFDYPAYLLPARRDFSRPPCWAGWVATPPIHPPLPIPPTVPSGEQKAPGAPSALQFAIPTLQWWVLFCAQWKTLEAFVGTWIRQRILHEGWVAIRTVPSLRDANDLGFEDRRRLVMRVYAGFVQSLSDFQWIELTPTLFWFVPPSTSEEAAMVGWTHIRDSWLRMRVFPAWVSMITNSERNKRDTAVDEGFDSPERQVHVEVLQKAIIQTFAGEDMFFEPFLRSLTLACRDWGVCDDEQPPPTEEHKDEVVEERVAAAFADSMQGRVQPQAEPSSNQRNEEDDVVVKGASEGGSASEGWPMPMAWALWQGIWNTPDRTGLSGAKLEAWRHALTHAPLTLYGPFFYRERVRSGIRQLYQAVQGHLQSKKDLLFSKMANPGLMATIGPLLAATQKAIVAGLTHLKDEYMRQLDACHEQKTWDHMTHLIQDSVFAFLRSTFQLLETEMQPLLHMQMPRWLLHWSRSLPDAPVALFSHWIDAQLEFKWIHSLHFPFYVLATNRMAWPDVPAEFVTTREVN